MKALVEYVVQSLVDDPEAVTVYEVDGPTAVTLELAVARADMGRVIGKSGRVVNAIRALVQVSAAKQGKRVNLEIVEE